MQRNFICFFISLMVFSVLSNITLAQEIRVSGKVTDLSDNSVLPGVNIIVKGTTSGTTTDGNGNYTLDVPTANSTLVFSFVGYALEEVVVSSRSVINVALAPDVSQLKEIVVVGYGTQKREDLTGAVSSVSSKEITSIPTVNINQTLQGRVAGVFVNQTDMKPGGGISVLVRGAGSISSATDPIYVVDGVIMQGTINHLNPDDVESIDVLKDASATAIYGARGANGVVMITTKRGKAGKARIEYHGYYGSQQIIRQVPMMNAQEYANLRREAYYNSNPTTYPYFTTSPINQPFFKADSYSLNNAAWDSLDNKIFRPYELKTLAEGKTYNWQDEILRRAPMQNHSISVSGGNESTKYLLSLNYLDQEGIIKGSGFSRITTRLNLDQKITNKFDVGTNVNVARNKENVVPSYVFYSAIAANPMEPFTDENGQYRLNLMETGTAHPLAAAESVDNEVVTDRMFGNIYATYEFIPGLNLRTSFGADIYNWRSFRYAPSTVSEGNAVGGRAELRNSRYLDWLWENTLNYTKVFGDHTITALLGTSMQERNTDENSMRASKFPSDVTSYKNITAGSEREQLSSNFTRWAIASWYSRINYSFKDKYLLTATARIDGSSRFGANNKYAFFPSASAAWKLSEESAIQDLGLFSTLKLRAGYGSVGNQEIGLFNSLTLMSPYNYSFNNQPATGYVLSGTYGNPDLRWESQDQYNVGMDFGFLQNRFTINADYYVKDNKGLLQYSQLPISGGFAQVLENVARVRTNGLELALNANLLSGPLQWNINATWSGIKTEVLSLAGDKDLIRYTPSGWDGNSAAIKVGEPLGLVYYYKFDGLYREGDTGYSIVQSGAKRGMVYAMNGEDSVFIKNNGRQMYEGGIKIVDVNGDNQIDLNDETVVGSTQPKGYGGFGTDLSYKGISLSAFFNFSYGHVIYNRSYDFYMINVGNWIGNHTDGLDRWTPDNKDTNVPYAYYWHTAPGAGYVNSSRFVEKGDFLRMKTITLGYNLPESLVNKAKLSDVNVYITGHNLWTLTNFTGFDPEGNQGFGWAADTYPSAKMVMVGLRVGI